MSSVVVTCPKCTKRQPVDAVVPAEGLRYACKACQTVFLVKLPPGAQAASPARVDEKLAPPPAWPPRSPASAAPGLELNEPGAASPGDLPFFQEDLPAPRGPHASSPLDTLDFGSSDPSAHQPLDLNGDQGVDLPGFRDDIPMPSDLPGFRDDIPRPDDLPGFRDDVPRPDDLPGFRDDVPRPDDLPGLRDDVPMPGDLPGPRDEIPMPGDLPAPRDQIPLAGDFPISRDAVPRHDDLLASRDDLQLPGDLPTPLSAVPGQGNLPVSRMGAPSPQPSVSKPELAPPDAMDFDPFAELSSSSSPLEPLHIGGAATLTPGTGLSTDGRFGLELEGAQTTNEDTGAAKRPLNYQLPRKQSGGRDDQLTPLAPVARRSAQSEDSEVAAAPSRKRHLVVVGGVVGIVAVAAGGFFVMKARRAEPRPEVVLGPLSDELAHDRYPSYQRATDKLLEATGQHPEGVTLRAAAAEELLLAFLAHGGERSKLSQAEQIVTALPTQEAPNPYAARARALLAIARGKTGEVAGLLGSEAGTPEGDLVIGLRDLTAGKREPAAAAFRRFIAARPERLLGHYLLGRALEEKDPAGARKAYQAVLAKAPEHFGAALGMARLAEGPSERLAAVQALLDKKATGMPRSEMGEAFVAVGQAAQALGRTAEASTAFTKALAADPHSATVNVAIGESYMFEGRYPEALQRFQAAGAEGLRTVAGKLGMGGALVANGKREPGLATLRQAAAENPKDPRALFYAALASATATPPDLEGAAQNYRTALVLDKKFLPASLRLAALYQSQGKPEEALAALKAAEEAGAPPTALQIAWGEALLQAKDPVRAEEVFGKAIIATPKEVPAHLGLAAALEAQGRGEAAKTVLEKAVGDMPDEIAAKEHLAGLLARLGHKEEALTHYQAVIATNRAPQSARVALAKLQLELGKVEEAQRGLEKVVDENPGAPEALFTLARTWEARNDMGRAVQEYRRALRFENGPVVQLAFARALLRLGKEPEAMTALESAIALPEALIERGRVYYRKGDYEKAAVDLQSAVQLAPKDGQAWLWLGLSQDKLGDADKAAEAWRTAVQLAPDDGEAHYRLGRYELDKGHTKIAVAELRKAAAKIPEKADWAAEAYFQLGTAEVASGARGPALAAFRKYLEVAPADAASLPEAKRQITRLGGK